MISKECFDGLCPRSRGYAVYMFGSRADQPHVPDEENPYPEGSVDANEWDIGQQMAVIEVMDSEG